MGYLRNKLRAYIASILFELKRGKNLPILNFQFEQLTKAIVKKSDIDKESVKSYLVSMFGVGGIKEGNEKITKLLTKYDIGSMFDSVMV